MPRNKLKTFFLIAFIILFACLNYKPTFAQEIAILEEVSPNTGSIGEEVNLQLWGDGFDNLGELTSVRISGQALEIRGYRRVSNQLIEVLIWIPEQTPVGETEIRFIFDDKTVMDAFFIVTESGDRGETRRTEEPRGQPPPGEPVLWGLYPNEGDVDTDIELYLDGENLTNLGELIVVTISGFKIPVWEYSPESNESFVIYAYLPENTPLGYQTISIAFENAEMKEDFYVNAASDNDFPIAVVIGGGVAVAVGGATAIRRLRKPKRPKETPEERPTQPRMSIKFNVEVDMGTQSLEITDSDQTRPRR